MYNFSNSLSDYNLFDTFYGEFEFAQQTIEIGAQELSNEDFDGVFSQPISFFDISAKFAVNPMLETANIEYIFDMATVQSIEITELVDNVTSCCPCVSCDGQNGDADFVAAMMPYFQDGMYYHSHAAPDPSWLVGSEGYDIQSMTAMAPMSDLTFTLNNTGGVEPGTDAESGFLAAVALWQSFLSDDVDIRLDVGFASLSPGVLGSAGSSRAVISYEVYRDALIADGTSPDDATAIANLEMSNSLSFATQDQNGTFILDNNNSANNNFLAINRTTALALGITIDANGNPVDDGSSAYASITFNSDFTFDFDPTDGIDAGAIDFVGVAFHEIGHALGFTSGVDIVDNNSTIDLNGFAIFNQLDVFRYSDNAQTQFGAGTRDLGYGGDPYFSIDGGATNLGFFSSGRQNGDGQQASHWRDNLSLGIMDPTSAPRGQANTITELDIRAFDVIGWDRVGQNGDINGTSGDDDPLDGTPNDDTINGLGGNDVINGFDGDDTIFAGSGNDVVNGGNGRDILHGEDGDDVLNGDAGNDDFFGGSGSDSLNGGAGQDRVFYSDAMAGITANFINQSLNTGDAAGDSYNSIESITGSNFDDVITSGNDNNDLIGLGGNDVLVGARGRDRLFGGDGEDRLLGGLGDDDLLGQGGADTYVIQTGAGEDRIFGYEVGVDVIQYIGGPGDMMDLTIEQIGANTQITSDIGILTLIGIDAATVTVADFIFSDPAPEATGVTVTTDLTAGNDIFVGDENDDIVNGLDGNDTITGGIGDDTLNGGDGNDLLTGGLGADALIGGEGIDRVLYTNASVGVTINVINPALNTGEAAGDTYDSIENFSGSNGDDSITSGNAANVLIGLGGDDVLLGAGGNDTLFGGDDDDRLIGGTGDDNLFGQGGSDTFVFFANAGNDIIRDFEDGVDIIQFRDMVDAFTDLTITQDGANAVITSDNGVITLINFDSTLLDIDDFSFL